MKVKLLVSRSGADGSQSPGEVVEVSTKEGQALIDSGQAEPVKVVKSKAKK